MLPSFWCFGLSDRKKVDKSAQVTEINIVLTGRSSAWLERTVRVREAGGSNPLAPTIFKAKPIAKFGGWLFSFVSNNLRLICSSASVL